MVLRKPLLILAPLAGFTGSAFRRLARKFGAEITWTELISAKMILAKGLEGPLLHLTPEERPLRFQLHGSDPEDVASAAQEVMLHLRPDGLDLNAGCPAPKIIQNGAGAALLKDLPKLFEIARMMRQVASAFGVEASAKFRLGFEQDIMEQIAETLLKAGIKILALHPRTAKQGFSGKAHWERVRDLKRLVGQEALVFLSGDIHTWKDFYRAYEETGCDGIMIGRAALKRPWIFREIKEKRTLEFDLSDRIRLLQGLFHTLCEYMHEERAWKVTKLFIPKFLHGLPGRKKVVSRLLDVKDLETFKAFLLEKDEINHLTFDEPPEAHR